MTVFGKYAQYYDLFYRDKNYADEADYVDRLIRKHHPDSSTLLDLGCGTGQHDLLLARKGYQVTGVDRSEEMLRVARQQSQSTETEDTAPPCFHHGDVRDFRLQTTFDVVISLFHVVSYQPTNADLRNILNTAAAHLKPGGIFIFDCWYGPGVLQDLPKVGIKEFEDDRVSITRIAIPTVHEHDNLVDIKYHLIVRHKNSKKIEEIKEIHRMRYLFRPELLMLMEDTGFAQIGFSEFLKETMPGNAPWNVCLVGRKQDPITTNRT